MERTCVPRSLAYFVVMVSFSTSFGMAQMTYQGIIPGHSRKIDVQAVLRAPVMEKSSLLYVYAPQEGTGPVVVGYRPSSDVVDFIEVPFLEPIERSALVTQVLGDKPPQTTKKNPQGELFEYFGNPYYVALFYPAGLAGTGVTSIYYYSNEAYLTATRAAPEMPPIGTPPSSGSAAIAKTEPQQAPAPVANTGSGQTTSKGQTSQSTANTLVKLIPPVLSSLIAGLNRQPSGNPPSSNRQPANSGGAMASAPPQSASDRDGRAIQSGVFGSGVNLALNKRAKMSSVYAQGPQWDNPQGGVDGKKDGGWGFHTAEEQNPWWEVDLGASYSLNEVRIFNRMDCCRERTRTLRVNLSNDDRNWQTAYVHNGSDFGGIDGNPLRVPLNVQARFVRVQLNERNYLHLDEIEVYSSGSPAPLTQPAMPANNYPIAQAPRYLGCWKDSDDRAMPAVHTTFDSQLTNAVCVQHCRQQGYGYAGTQFHSHCFCANDYRKYGQASDSECNTPCAGNKSEMCGGPWRNSVYTAGFTAQ